MSELLKFAYHLSGQAECSNCGEPFEYNRIKFKPSQKSYDLDATIQCQNCANDYVLLVEDIGHGVVLDIFREGQDIESDHAVPSLFSHKASLHEELHQARDLVEGISELMDALEILEVNVDRITESVAELRKFQGFDTTDEFDQEIDANVHNYLAAAYSFYEILDTVRGELPTGGPVELKLEAFEDERRVISGLRTYVQHYLTLPMSYSQHVQPSTGDRRISVVVDIEDIDEIESDVGRYPPDGYMQGVEHHYGHVDNDFIDVELRVQSHYNAADTLVSSIFDHAQDVRGDDLADYVDKTNYADYYDS